MIYPLRIASLSQGVFICQNGARSVNGSLFAQRFMANNWQQPDELTNAVIETYNYTRIKLIGAIGGCFGKFFA